MISEKDKAIVRELAKRYVELTSTEAQMKMHQRTRDTNDLKIVRPPVIINEIPWLQMNYNNELDCICENSSARGIEFNFRRALLYMKYFKADNLYEPFIRVEKAYDSSSIGIERQYADTKKGDNTAIISREIIDVLEDESALEKIHDPVFTLRPDKDAAQMEFLTDLLGDSIPIKLQGFPGFCFAPWDDIAFLRGVEPIFFDLYDRPEYLHALMKKIISATNAHLDFVEKNLEIDSEFKTIHCTPAAISGKGNSGLKATWFRGAAQALGSVSPDMFEEFEIDYIKPIAERFAYTYYGCCEPLDNKIDKVKKISNLRKIGCSPWASVEACAEQIGNDYVLARKPNPAHVAIKTDPEVIRKETEETVKACIKYGCPYELVLKDISTVSNRPENLIVWADTVNEVLNKYYGE